MTFNKDSGLLSRNTKLLKSSAIIAAFVAPLVALSAPAYAASSFSDHFHFCVTLQRM